MSQVRLDRYEADGRLPMVCMRCGEPATVTRSRNMSWCPPWVGVLFLAGLVPYVIVAMILTKRARVQVPLCDSHKGHWLYRLLIVLGSFFLLLFVGIVGAVLFAVAPRQFQDSAGPFMCLGGAFLFIIWVVVLIVAQNTAIRPREITDDEIMLTGVCNEFVAAVDEAEHARLARRRERRRLRDDEDDDEDEEPAPRRKRPATDAFEEDDRPRKRRPPDVYDE
jgi:hypothetical protein